MKPQEIRRIEKKALNIKWPDHSETLISSETLRLNCPCASCKEARGDSSHSQPLTAKKSSLRVIESSKEEETSLEEIWAVGNYAIGVKWQDGHSTGIYTFKYLAELANRDCELPARTQSKPSQ